MAYGGRKGRRRNPLPSIHDPADPSPDTLPEGARREWGAAYREGLDLYQKDDLAQRSAWRQINLTWKQSGKDTWSRCKDGVCYWPSPMQLPEPKSDLVGLGVLVEYVFLDKKGELNAMDLDKDHPPILWWDKKRKALFAFPKQPYPTCRYTDDFVSAEARAEYEKWHKREPECFDEIAIPDVKVRPVGAMDSLSYASDKWNDADSDPALLEAQQYIHNHWYDVWVWQDASAKRGVPNAIMIQGGELDLHARGLIH